MNKALGLVLAGTVLAAAAWGWERRAMPEIFTSVPAEFRKAGTTYDKAAIYLDCGPESVTIQPGGAVVAHRELLLPDNEVRKQVEKVAADPRLSYLFVLQRPGSARTFAAVQRIFSLQRLEVAHEFVDAGVPLAEALKGATVVRGELARPRDKVPVFIECRSNGMFYVSNQELGREVARFVDRYRPLSRREDIAAMEQGLARREFSDENYEVESQAISVGKLRLRNRPGTQGETAAEIETVTSRLRTRLKELDPRQRYVRLMVRDDSFELARRTRAVVEQAGFEWRSQLLEGDEPLEFAQ